MKLTIKQIKSGYNKACDIHKNHLKADQVKLPRWGTAKSYWLGILISISPKSIHKDEISELVKQFNPSLGSDQQVRHLKRYGWNLESPKRGEHAISDPFKAHSGYAREKHKNTRLINAKDFEAIKDTFANKCATCGAIEGEPDPRYGDDKVKLQEGHRDPEKPKNLSNTIPQCQNCNRTYKDDFTFDKKGRVRAVASEKPVLRASIAVRKKIKQALNKDPKII